VEVTDIETLAARMRATGMGELEWRHAGSLLRLTRAGSAAQVEVDDASTEAPAATPEHIVRAPAVGTFVVYHPVTREPFAARGSRVNRGDVIALLECAGFLREVTADADGIVRDVLANDATLVEYGQPLLTLNIEGSE
jgi:acetyl-CoA carboxylase biotin carboxyl carrier protein